MISRTTAALCLLALAAPAAHAQLLDPAVTVSGAVGAGVGSEGTALRLSLDFGGQVALSSRAALSARPVGPEHYLHYAGELTTGVRVRALRTGPLDLAVGTGIGLGLAIEDDGSPYVPPLSIDLVVPVEAEANLRVRGATRLALIAHRSFATGAVDDSERVGGPYPSVGNWGVTLGLRFGG